MLAASMIMGQDVVQRKGKPAPRAAHSNLPFLASFTDVTERAGLLRTGWVSAVTIGDYNSDGFEDILITDYGQNVLYRNNGDGTFTGATRVGKSYSGLSV